MGKKLIRLLILVKSIDGGTGTYVFQLLKLEEYINNSIIKVIVLEKPSFRKIDKYSDKFIFYNDKNFYPQVYKFSLKNIFNIIRELFWVKNQINKFHPGFVLSVDVHCNLLILINKFIFRRAYKIVLTTHINLSKVLFDKAQGRLNWIIRKLVSFFYNQSDNCVVVSKNVGLDLLKNFQLKKDLVKVIYNGITPLKQKIIVSNKNKKIIITIARLVNQKDHLILIKSFALLNKKLSNTELWILSDGYLKNNLINYVNKINLSKKVHFFGWVKDIYPYLNQAYVFVLSSKREGFSYALIEAMAQGRPVISTDSPFGPSEVLDNGKYGILVPVGDEKKMANAMYELLTDEKKYNYYAQKSLERAKYFSLDKMLKAYKKLILEVLNK